MREEDESLPVEHSLFSPHSRHFDASHPRLAPSGFWWGTEILLLVPTADITSVHMIIDNMKFTETRIDY